jgi:hypothetical protein
MISSRRASQGSGTIGRILAVALASALALSHARPVQAVQIPADTVYVSYAVTATPQGSMTICVRDKLTITTQVAVRVSRAGNQAFNQYELTPGMYAARIQSEARGVGSVSPAHRETRSEAGSGAIANFVFTSSRPGHATLIFEYVPSPEEDVLAPLDTEDELAPLVAPVRIRHLNPSPAVVEVEVKRCKYQIRATSNWTIETGFRTHAVSVLQAEVTPDDDGNFDVTVPVQDQAYWLRGFPCPHSVNASESQASLQGNVTDGEIDFDITYETVSTKAVITCPAPVIGKVEGKNQDTGKALVMSRDDLNVHQSTLLFGSVATTEPHTLEADGTWQGAAMITVTTLPG